jgi:integrase
MKQELNIYSFQYVYKIQKMTTQDTQKQLYNEQSPLMRNFIETLNGSQITRESYFKWINVFFKFCQVQSAEELVAKYSTQNDIQDVIIRFLLHCKNIQEKSPTTILTYYHAIKHFYEMNDIALNWKRIKMFLGRANGKKSEDRPYKAKEIAKLLEHADPRSKVIVLLMASAGLRRGAITELKIGHLEPIELEEEKEKEGTTKIYQITVYKGTDSEYITYCSTECAAVIDTYISFRKRHKEKVNDNSYLVINYYDKRQAPLGEETTKKIAEKTIGTIMLRLLDDAGLKEGDKLTKPGDRHIMQQCHALRKFFGSQLEHADMKDLSIERLLGHKTGLRGTYRKVTDNDLQNEYLKCMPYLIINEEERQKLKVQELTKAREQDQRIWQKKYEEQEARVDAKLDALKREFLSENK